jgi:hypothetical protein
MGTITPTELFNLGLVEAWTTLDVRPPEAYAEGHIFFAWSLPWTTDHAPTCVSLAARWYH